MPESPPRSRVPATIGILLGIFLSALEGTVVGTAMPTIASELDGVKFYFLPIAVYMLVATVPVPVFGRLSDLHGRKRLHLLGVLLFIGGSALCGLSTSMATLTAFRSVQALGASVLMPLSFTMIAELYPFEERAKMQGMISGIWGVASVVGPPVGGFLTAHFGWRSVFLVIVPFGLLSAAVVQSVWRDGPRAPAKHSLDLPGAGLMILASSAILAAFALARNGWTSGPVLGLLGAAALLLVLLAVVERRSPEPFLPFDLFRDRLFGTGIVCGGFAAACLFCAVSYLPLYVQAVLRAGPVKAGMVLTPMMAGWISVSIASGWLMGRYSIRRISIVGATVLLGGHVLLARLGPGSAWTDAALGAVLVGTGLGSLIAPLLIAVQNSVDRTRLGQATAMTQFSRSMMGTMAVGVMGALMSASLAAAMAARPDLVALGATPDAVVNPVLRTRLPEGTAAALRELVSSALRPVFLTGAVTAALALLSAFLLPEHRPASRAART